MTPQRPYAGQAPSAMSTMGQGFAETGANIGRLEQQGWAAMGEGVAKGMTGAAGAYADYKKMSSGIKSSESFFKDMKESGYLDPKLSSGIDATVNSEAYKNMGTFDKAAYWENLKSYAGQSISSQAKIQQIAAEQAAATGRTMLSESGATERSAAAIEAARLRQEEELRSLEKRNKINQIIGFMGNAGSSNLDRAGGYSNTFNGSQSMDIGLGGGIYNRPR